MTASIPLPSSSRRISRSSLALPTRQEQEARLALLEGELARYRQSNEEAVSQVKTVALKYGVTLDPRFITNVDFPTALDNKPDFVEARTRAAQNTRILQAVERAYGDDEPEYTLDMIIFRSIVY